MVYEVDLTNPRAGWRGRMLGRITFVPKKIDKDLRTRHTSYGEQKYFLVWPEDSEQVLSLPAKYWPTQFNVGDKVTMELEVAKYNPGSTWVNISNFKDSVEHMVIEKLSVSAANGPQQGISVKTGYIGNPKRNEWGETEGNYRAIRATTNLTGVKYIEFTQGSLGHSDVQGPFVSPQMKISPNRSLEVALEDLNWALQQTMFLSRDDLQYAEMIVNGTKTGEKLVVDTIVNYMPIVERLDIEMHLHEMTFIDSTPGGGLAGATFEFSVQDGDTMKTYRGFIPESDFPFDCTTITNSIKKMYPEEFAYPIQVKGLFTRFDRVKKSKDTGEWSTEATMQQIGSAKMSGLDIPTIADGLKRVNQEFYVNEKYAKAAAALKSIKGMVTYNRAAKTFGALGLSFTEDEYHREIESRLIAEHRDYDREYFDMLKEQIDDCKDTEWGGDTETGEFLAIFPEEKLIVVEMPVPNRATYCYRIRDGMSLNDALSRINLASPANGIRRTALISGNTFKEAIVDTRAPADKPKAQAYLDDLVSDGLISSDNENLKSWTGFIGRIMHRSYENYDEKLRHYLKTASTMVLTTDGFEMPKQNPIGATLVSAMVSGAVAAIVGDYVGRQQVSEDIDDALQQINTAKVHQMNELFNEGYILVGVGDDNSLEDEIHDADEKGYSDIQTVLADNGVVFILGKDNDARANPDNVSEQVVEAYETFHDQPHKNVVKARAHEKKSSTRILGPMKHVIYFCSKWSEDEEGNVIDENNVDVHYIHEWNEDGGDNDCGDNCMYVAADDKMKNIIILGNCEVLDVGITDSEKPNASAEKLLKKYTAPKEMSWIGDCKEIAYIDGDGKKQTIKLGKTHLCTDSNLKKLYLVEE